MSSTPLLDPAVSFYNWIQRHPFHPKASGELARPSRVCSVVVSQMNQLHRNCGGYGRSRANVFNSAMH